MDDYKLSEICFLVQELTSKSCQFLFGIIDPDHTLFILKQQTMYILHEHI